MSDFPSVSLGAVLAGVQLLAVGFTRHTSGCTNSSWTSIESSTYICSSPCSEAQLELAQLRAELLISRRMLNKNQAAERRAMLLSTYG